MTDLILVATLTFILTTISAIIIYKRISRTLHSQLKVRLLQINEAERQIHLKEMEYLAEKNKINLAHIEIMNRERQRSFDEGRKQGKAEHELEAATHLANQRNEFASRLHVE